MRNVVLVVLVLLFLPLAALAGPSVITTTTRPAASVMPSTGHPQNANSSRRMYDARRATRMAPHAGHVILWREAASVAMSVRWT